MFKADTREKDEMSTKVTEEIKKEQTKDNQSKQEKPIEEKNRKKRGRKVFALVTVLLISVLVLGYVGFAAYFENHFFPGTVINGLNCENKTKEEATEIFKRFYEEQYTLTLLDRDKKEILKITPQDVGMSFEAEEKISAALENQNALEWIFCIWEKTGKEAELAVTVEINKEVLLKTLEQASLFEESENTKPRDAYISGYSEEIKGYTIVPEEEGNTLNKETTLLKVSEALKEMNTEINLAEEKCYEQPLVTSENPTLQAELKELNQLTGTCITYDWNGTEEILDGDLIHQWLILENGEVILNREAVEDYVAEQAREHDTYGKKRKFLTTLGEELTLPGGAYGWKTDRETETEALMELILSGAVTEREPEYSCRGWVKGKNDIGTSYVEIDLTNQHLYLYEEGVLVLETDFVSGSVAEGNATPAGVFGLTYKTRDAVLRGQTYETPVSYWMPFNGNIGMHDATWRRKFGGDIYLTNGSHGCVNLPLDMAAAIYEHVKKGFPVICYYY